MSIKQPYLHRRWKRSVSAHRKLSSIRVAIAYRSLLRIRSFSGEGAEGGARSKESEAPPSRDATDGRGRSQKVACIEFNRFLIHSKKKQEVRSQFEGIMLTFEGAGNSQTNAVNRKGAKRGAKKILCAFLASLRLCVKKLLSF